MGVVQAATGGYALGFLLLAAVALGCLAVLVGLHRARAGPS
jgi:biotin transporter BioY